MNISPPQGNRLRRFFTNPKVHIAAGLLLTLTAGIEIIENLDELFVEQSNIGGHHGMFFYGLVTTFHKVAEFMEGAIAVDKNMPPPKKE